MSSDWSAMLAESVTSDSKLRWEGSLEEHLPTVIERPYLAERAHARIYRMLASYGVTDNGNNTPTTYHFWDGHIFGLERQKAALADYFRAASQGMEIGRRILLLMGPPAGGKSSIMSLLKSRLSAWTKTDDGAVYAIKGCPMHENPLHLLPEPMRVALKAEHKIIIDGDLCPMCRWKLNAPVSEGGWGEDPRRARIHRIVLSEENRIGIGTFTPSDPKSQDISELVGSIDLATIGIYGSESDPRAYRFDGELQIANRGFMEFVEGLKVDEKFLYTLIPVAQERVVKTPKHPFMSVDVAVVTHTNESEFTDFKAKARNEALLDRMHVVVMPYNLKVSDEEQIYARMLSDGNFAKVHIAPGTLRSAAQFAVLSRLDAKDCGDKLTLVDKAKLYDGTILEGWTVHQVKEMQDRNTREGMIGLSPRFIIDGVSKALKPGCACITPMAAMKGLLEHLDHHPKIEAKEKEGLKNLLALTRQSFDEDITKLVSKACIHAFDEQAQALVSRYLAEVSAWKNKDKLVDDITGEHRAPDEKWMRGVEEFIGVSTSAAKEFREEILFRLGQLALKGKQFTWDSHPRLKEAVEKRLYADVKGIMKGIVGTQSPDAQQARRIDSVIAALVEDGYCDHCAREIFRYAGSKLDV